MLETDDRAGEDICGLCAVKSTTPGENTEAAGEYTEIIAGEPRSETVWHPTADGVAFMYQRWIVPLHVPTYMLLDSGRIESSASHRSSSSIAQFSAAAPRYLALRR